MVMAMLTLKAILLRHIKFAIEYNALFMRFYITYELCGVKMEPGKH